MSSNRRHLDSSKATELYEQGEREWARGRLRSAFLSFLSAAEAGNVPSLFILSHFYDDGIGAQADHSKALFWYERAYRKGSGSAANNAGVIWRDRGDTAAALLWFKRAAKMGDNDANLNIAKVYLKTDKKDRAVSYLEQTLLGEVTEGSKQEARELLKTVGRRT